MHFFVQAWDLKLNHNPLFSQSNPHTMYQPSMVKVAPGIHPHVHRSLQLTMDPYTGQAPKTTAIGRCWFPPFRFGSERWLPQATPSDPRVIPDNPKPAQVPNLWCLAPVDPRPSPRSPIAAIHPPITSWTTRRFSSQRRWGTKSRVYCNPLPNLWELEIF